MAVEIQTGAGLRGAGAELRAMRGRAGGRPLAIAHRAGNEPRLLELVLDAGADLIETDVWLYRGRVEVRHKKSLGPYLFWERYPVSSGWRSPFSYLRDRWRLYPGWRDRLHLNDVLPLARPETRFLLDLKGRDVGLAAALLDVVRRHRAAVADGHGDAPPILVCSPFWDVLEAAGQHPDVRIIYSVGRDAALARVWDKLAALPDPAVSIHVRYLGKDLPHLARFKSEGVAVITWPVNDVDLCRDLTDRGVDGLTSDTHQVLEAVITSST
jgi:glycerophosphoryl diester phosphodiesterase